MKTYIIIPTYNERENISRLINEILKLKIKDLHIIVVDDNSPDKTGEAVKEMEKKDENVHLLLRTEDRGRGAAGRSGFIYCLENNADVIVEMDADFSHDPKYIPALLSELKNADVVLGSRRASGGKEIGRSPVRKLITLLANLYIRIILGIKVKDANSGFRCFSRKAMEAVDPYRLASKGPSIVQEVLFKAHLKGLRIKEVPIVFKDRTEGKSKLGFRQLAAGYWMVMKLKMQHMRGAL